MKKLLLAVMIVLFANSFANAQFQVVSGHISTNTTWTNDKIYRMDGFIYVDSNATLTIQPGTVIRGIKSSKGALIVTRGGKLIADGTIDKPIVFTSDEPAGQRFYGDWGGVIILGNAPINPVGGQATIEGGVNNANGDGQYGGPNAADNSGILRYVRIEFGGIPFSANNEINGLTLGGVGNGTIVDYVMVSFNGDDSFEWFGGTVNCKHLIAYKGVDDDFDTDFGYSGRVQFGLAVRDANVADQAGDSNSFESDNDATGQNQATPKTKALFSNITSVGPKVLSSSTVNAKYNNALRLRRNTACSAYNSVFMGWPNGVYIEGDSSANNANLDLLQISNTIVSGSVVPLKKLSTNITFDVTAWFNGSGKKDSVLTENADVMLTAPFAAVPNCLPLTGSPVLGRASFTNPKLQNAAFTATTYIGAFGSTDWTATWANFDPQTTNYSVLPATPSFTYSVNGNVATFTNTSVNALTYSWNFGDNSTSTDVNPVHTYANNGAYNVVLTADNGVKTYKDSLRVTINTGPQYQIVSGHITSNTTWTNNKIYRMDGFVYVDSNATLTIQAGTVIRGIKNTKGALIITRGGKLIADGTVDKPIIFTSDEPAGQRFYGDWGGVIILGNAPINPVGGQATIEGGVNNANGDGQYGGPNAADNSGVLRYVRIEFGGIPFSANNEINGLTLGGVGNGTIVDYVMVSFNGDDSFEWFGGTVNCKHLIAYKGVDDDFDTDFGFSGKVQFGLAVRDANVADQAGDSNSFESDNDATGQNQATPKTKALFSNITSVGPKVLSSSTVNAKYNNALRLRRNTACSAYNSVFMGWPNGVYIEGDSAANNANLDLLQISNTIVSGSVVPLKKLSTNITFDVTAWFNNLAKKDTVISENAGVMLSAPFAAVPNCLPLAGSPVLGRASFTNPRLQDAAFEPTTYVGAFGSDDWTATWTNFDPQNYNYSLLPVSASFTALVSNFDVTFTNTSLNAFTYAWDFGDNSTSTLENPIHTYAANGTYKVVLTADNGVKISKDSMDIVISAIGINSTKAVNNMKLYPNPTSSNATVAFTLNQPSKLTVKVCDVNGREVALVANNKMFDAGAQQLNISAEELEAGIYIVHIANQESTSTIRFAVIK